MKLEKIKTITIIVLILILWFKGCSNSEIPIYSKPVTGSFKPVKSNNTNLGSIDTIFLTKFVKLKPIIEYKNNEVNKELAIENYNIQMAYTKATDSLERLKMYIDAIQLKSFNKTFEDDYLSATLKGISQGEVKSLELEYELKKIPLEKTKLRMFLGSGISLKAIDLNLGFQNSKGNILEIGYDTEKNIRVGYKKTIFSIKKL